MDKYEIGWLIESREGEYLTISQDDPRGAIFYYNHDASAAVRFARQRDAQDVIDTLTRELWLHTKCASEHMWIVMQDGTVMQKEVPVA